MECKTCGRQMSYVRKKEIAYWKCSEDERHISSRFLRICPAVVKRKPCGGEMVEYSWPMGHYHCSRCAS